MDVPGDVARHRMKNWEIIADNLHKAGWSLGWVSALDVEGRTIWIVDAHRDDGRRFIVHADETLTAFLELESATRACGELPRQSGESFPKLTGYESKHSTSSNYICTRLLRPFAEGAGSGPAARWGVSQWEHSRRTERAS